MFEKTFPGAAAAEFETRPKRKSGSLPELGLAALPPKKQRPEEEEEGDVMEVGLSRNVLEFLFFIEVKLTNFSSLKIKQGR
jgi:hypothetical protein